MAPRVLMLGWNYPPDIEGGLDVHVAEVFPHLEEQGMEARLALPEDNCPEGEDFIPLDAGEGSIMEKSARVSSGFVEAAREFDVVHTHDWFGAESGLKASKYAGCGWVATFHSLAGSRSRTPSEDVERRERACVDRADVLTAVSEMLADRVEERHSRRPRVVRNAASRAETSGTDVRDRHGIETDEDLVLYVGRMAEQKNVELLVRAMEDVEAHLLLAGEGHRRGALERLAEILEVGEKVSFAGFVPEEELGDYYSAADVFVSPSMAEPFGLTITEALDAGTTVVATESGASELVESGIVEAERNSGSLARGIQRALDGEVEIEVADREWEDAAQEYAEIYRELSQ